MPRCVLAFAMSLSFAVSASSGADSPRVQAVRAFADNVLRYGRDTYGPRHTPLLIDGLNVDTHEPVTWILPDEFARVWKMPKRWILCNVASQQALFRTFEALTAITGDDRYRRSAEEATTYALQNLQFSDGLLYWGGHAAVDLATEQAVGESNKDWSKPEPTPLPADWEVGVEHELKFHFPYYELMWRVNREATSLFVLGFWSAHVQNWSNLDMNRHGIYGRNQGLTWDHEYVGGPVPFKGKGLSFIHTGSDMMYAAALLTEFTGDQRPLEWAKRLAGRYEQIRHPKTGLGPDIYAYYRNERMLAQFGPEWGDRITETSVASLYGGRYSYPVVCLLKLSQRLGPQGDTFRDLAIRDLQAFAKHAYDPTSNTFRSMLIDGTPLHEDTVKRPGPISFGYFGPRGAGAIHFWAYMLGAVISDDPLLWDTARSIGRGIGLGDIGGNKGAAPDLNREISADAPELVFALLDLHQATGHRAFLETARRVGDNILARQFHNGFFLRSPKHLYAKFDSPAALSLLYLEVALTGGKVKLPPYYGGHSYFHCDYESEGRTYDGEVIYSRVRSQAAAEPPTE